MSAHEYNHLRRISNNQLRRNKHHQLKCEPYPCVSSPPSSRQYPLLLTNWIIFTWKGLLVMNERVLVQAKLRSLAVAERKHSLKHF